MQHDTMFNTMQPINVKTFKRAVLLTLNLKNECICLNHKTVIHLKALNVSKVYNTAFKLV